MHVLESDTYDLCSVGMLGFLKLLLEGFLVLLDDIEVLACKCLLRFVQKLYKILSCNAQFLCRGHEVPHGHHPCPCHLG